MHFEMHVSYISVHQLCTSIGVLLHTRVLAKPFPKGTVPFRASDVPFGSVPKPTMCPLAPPFCPPLDVLDFKNYVHS